MRTLLKQLSLCVCVCTCECTCVCVCVCVCVCACVCALVGEASKHACIPAPYPPCPYLLLMLSSGLHLPCLLLLQLRLPPKALYRQGTVCVGEWEGE